MDKPARIIHVNPATESPMPNTPEDINTTCLSSLTTGEIDPQSLKHLFAICHRELRAVAGRLMQNERKNHTLQPTALINEVYLRLFSVDNLPVEGRAHFVNIAARSMRQILVDYARRRNTAKRGADWRPVTLAGLSLKSFERETDVLEVNDALDKLAELDARAAEVVELRIFGGMTMDEIAVVLGLSRRTIQKDWRIATMWLRKEFVGPLPDPAGGPA